MAYSSWSVSFGEQPSAAKWNILGTNDAYFDSLIGSGTAWTSATPTWTNLTVGTGGNAYNTIYYQQLGKIVRFHGRVTLGSSGPVVGTNPYFVLPVTISTTAYPTGSTYSYPIGTTSYKAATVAYNGALVYNAALATSAAQPLYNIQASGATAGLAVSSPGTWAAGDHISYMGWYEAA